MNFQSDFWKQTNEIDGEELGGNYKIIDSYASLIRHQEALDLIKVEISRTISHCQADISELRGLDIGFGQPEYKHLINERIAFLESIVNQLGGTVIPEKVNEFYVDEIDVDDGLTEVHGEADEEIWGHDIPAEINP